MASALSVPAAVNSIIVHNQPVYACLKQKIVNYHALATVLKPGVEELTGRRTSINTLVVAIKRFSDNLGRDRGDLERPVNTLRGATIALTSGVADVTLRPRKSDASEVLKRIIDLSSHLDDSPDILKSSNLIKLVIDEKMYRSLLRPELKKKGLVRELTDLSRLTIHLSSVVDQGFPLFISELLYQQGINVVHSYIDEDTMVIVDESDGPRACEIIQREIMLAEEIPKSRKVRKDHLTK